MNKTTKWIVGVVVLALVVWGIVSSSNRTDTKGGPIRIGVVLPLSGPAAALGEYTKKAIDLAVDDLSERQKERISILYEDDQFDPKKTVSAVQKLINNDKISALVTYSSPSSVAASYIAEDSAVPMVGLGNASEINSGKRWVVRYMLGPEAQARAIEGLLLKGKYSRIAIVWNQSDGPKSVHDALIKVLGEGSYTVVADESVTKSETDFKSLVLKIKNSKPDVVVAYISPQVGVFAKQAKDLNIGIPLVSGPTFEIFDQISAAQGGLDNQLFASNNNVSFIERYLGKYGTYPTIANDYAFDAVTQIIKAVSDNDNKEDIMKSLKSDFYGVSGSYRYNGDGSFDLDQVVKKWDGKKFVIVK